MYRGVLAGERRPPRCCTVATLPASEEPTPPTESDRLADLYDPLTLPPELTKAHQTLDRAGLGRLPLARRRGSGVGRWRRHSVRAAGDEPRTLPIPAA